MVVEKSSLRDQYKRQLNELSSDEKQRQSDQIVAKLQEYLMDKKGLWTLFSPLNDEPNILKLVQTNSNIRWAFPKIESKEEIHFYKVENVDELICSSYGICEPVGSSSQPIMAQDIQGCLIPGIAFDSFGTRLGRGGGYYDRYLENYKGYKLGVTFEQGLTKETLPRKSHDQIMNIVVSPECWIEVDTSEVTNGI